VRSDDLQQRITCAISETIFYGFMITIFIGMHLLVFSISIKKILKDSLNKNP